jgi:hypothetical protein
VLTSHKPFKRLIRYNVGDRAGHTHTPFLWTDQRGVVVHKGGKAFFTHRVQAREKLRAASVFFAGDTLSELGLKNDFTKAFSFGDQI